MNHVPSKIRSSFLHQLLGHDSADDRERTWSQFIKLYRPFLKGVIRRVGGPLTPDDRDNVLQEVLARVLKGLKGYDAAKGKFTHWLGKVCSNGVADYLRRRGRSIRAVGGTTNLEHLHDLEFSGNDRETERLIESETLRQTEARTRARLAKKRKVRLLRVLDGLKNGETVEEIAHDLDVMPRTIYRDRQRIAVEFAMQKDLLENLDSHSLLETIADRATD